MRILCVALPATLYALAVAAILSGCGPPSGAMSAPRHPPMASWPTYQHSPNRNAVFSNYSIPRDWSYDAGAKINGGLALVGNTLLFTTFSHEVVALDVRSGRELWHARLANVAMSTPIVAGSTVYVGTGNNGVLHRNLFQKAQFYRESVWGIPAGDEIAAFDLHTGASRWTYRTVGEDMPSAVYDHGRLIFANGDWHAYGLRADTGRFLWSTHLPGLSTMASAVMAGKAAIVVVCPATRSSHPSTVALDPQTGKILWTSPYGHCDGTPAYEDGKVFVSGAATTDSRLQLKTEIAALDARSGKPIWIYRGVTPGLWSIVGSNEVAIAGMYADGSYFQPAPLDDQIIAFDANTGKVRWRFHTSGPAKMSPVEMNGRLYIGDTAGMLYTLDARSGDLLEIREFRRPFTTSPPIVAGNKLIIVNGTSVDAIPLTGKPNISEPVNWEITPAMKRMNAAQHG